MTSDKDNCETMKACVLGGGAFGSALALVLESQGTHLSVWVRSSDQAKQVNESREHVKYLPGVKISELIQCTTDVSEAVDGVDLVLFAIRTQFPRSFAQTNRSTMPVGVPLVLCA